MQMSDRDASDARSVSTVGPDETTSEARDGAPNQIDDPARRGARDDANAILEAAAREAESMVREADGVAQRMLARAAGERDRAVVEARSIMERFDQQRRAILEQITALDHAVGALKATIEAPPFDAVAEMTLDPEDFLERAESRGAQFSLVKGTGVQPTPVFEEGAEDTG